MMQTANRETDTQLAYKRRGGQVNITMSCNPLKWEMNGNPVIDDASESR